jgi:hypothetical protein
MLDWLQTPPREGIAPALEVFPNLVSRLLIALFFGIIVAGIYALTQRKSRSELAPFLTTLVLLTILIAMVTLVIGDNVARAFGLVGALSIVRFRTVVEDTRDTAFVIFAVVVGMAAGAEPYVVPLLPLAGIPIVAAAALLLGHWGNSAAPVVLDFALVLRLGIGHDPDRHLREVFQQYLSHQCLRSTATARQGVALDLTYHVRLRRDEGAVAFVAALNKVEGVQNVELNRL